MIQVVTNGSEHTTELGRKLGKAVNSPVAFMLTGSYGTGKTTFTQGLAQGLGVEGLVRSPSYSIVKTYQGTRFRFVHADLYRMQSIHDIEELGLPDLLGDNSVIAVEWPGTVVGFNINLPRVELAFRFADENQADSPGGDDSRMIELEFMADCPAIFAEVARAFTA